MSEAGKLNVPIARTALEKNEIESVLGPLSSGWLVQGPKVREFEEKWSAFTGAAHSIAVTSCTSALHLSLVALGIGPGDEVIVPAFTWISTANVVEHCGAKPVFCDIDLETFNIDAKAAAAVVTDRTKAIIPVHLFGLCADMDAVAALAKTHGLAVVEDAACGFGARIGGRHAGTFGDTGCFSFHPRKAITTGEGGMVTCADEALAAQYVALDIEYKYHPERVPSIRTDMTPNLVIPAPLPPELYNIRTDPLEQHNLAAQEPSRVAQMQNALETWFEEVAAEGMSKRAQG